MGVRVTNFRSKIKTFLASDSPTLFLSRREVEELDHALKNDGKSVARARAALQNHVRSVAKRLEELSPERRGE